MNFGETLKKLRRDRDMTQESLAEYLNITTQAVSKWETNQSLPDIALIPIIANVFDTSADVLLGIDIESKSKRIDEILENAAKCSATGHSIEAVEILRGGLREYPNSFKLMQFLLHALFGAAVGSNSAAKDERTEMKKEIIRIGEKILAECTDDDCRHTAIQLLCYTYPDMGETEKAVALAEKMPSSAISSESLLRSIYKGDDRFAATQRCMFSYFDIALYDMKTNNEVLDDGSRPYTDEERVAICRKFIAITEILFEDGNYGFHNTNLSWTYVEMAVYQAKLGDYAGALESLTAAADFSIKSDTEWDSEKEYTSLLFRGKKFGTISFSITENDSKKQLGDMKKSVFDPIRERPEFAAIEERLKLHAAER
jgi:Predicted transcriptional regulators